MADENRKDALGQPTPERQGVREPQPIEGTSAARGRGDSDLETRREFEAADIARENESRRDRPDRQEQSGMLGRVRDAWDRLRHND